jgi:hypothetical protein
MIFLYPFSFSCGEIVSATVKMLFEEVSTAIMVKS